MNLPRVKRVFVIAIACVVLFVACFVGITLVALEQSGVVVAHTEAGDGTPRTTRIWFVQHHGSVLLEAGNPDNPWVKDLVRGSSLVLEGIGIKRAYHYELHTNEGNEQIRALMRAKYGWRDWWISLVFDTRNSFSISVAPIRE